MLFDVRKLDENRISLRSPPTAFSAKGIAMTAQTEA
jgi:hypothetical protein